MKNEKQTNKKLNYDIVVERARAIFGDEYEYPEFEYKNNKQKFAIICKKHGEFFKTYVTHVINEQGCKHCKPPSPPTTKNTKTTEQWVIEAKLEHGEYYDYSKSVYTKGKDKITITCPIHGPFDQEAQSHIRGRGCSKCGDIIRGKKQVKSQDDVIKDFIKKHGDTYDYSKVVYTGAFNEVTIVCKKHGDFDRVANDHQSGVGCRDCYLEGKRKKLNSKSKPKDIKPAMVSNSNGNAELVAFIQSIYDDEILYDDETLIAPKELSIVIPDQKLAIQYIKIHWGTDQNDNVYHSDKVSMCADLGYQLITIYEDEWTNRRTQVESKIKSLLGIDDRGVVYGRNCKVKEVSKKEKLSFLNDNHIQGDGPSSIELGLFNDDNLVAVMIFKKDSSYNFTLNRYATSKRVIGGFSKLLSHFKNNTKWNEILSFADLRWSDGNLYKTTGWGLDGTLNPDYYYLYNNERKHKAGFRKEALKGMLGDKFDSNKTEYENTFYNDIFRIWDSGKLRFKITNDKAIKVSPKTIEEKLLVNNKIRLLSEYTKASDHHDMECLECGHVWSATPKGKIQTFKETGNSGCPKCLKINRQKESVKKLIESIGDKFTFVRVIGYYEKENTTEKHLKVRVRNNICGHDVDSRVDNLKYKNVNCRTCNDIKKRGRFNEYNNNRSIEYRKTASDWEKYRADVHLATKVIYDKHHELINPDNLPRGKAGVEGAYQLDHIKSVRYCFDNDIPIDECAHIDNLQMLTWEENISKGSKILE